MKIKWIEDTPYCPYCEDSALYLTFCLYYCPGCHRNFGMVTQEEVSDED
jgi:hypothetical protein